MHIRGPFADYAEDPNSVFMTRTLRTTKTTTK